MRFTLVLLLSLLWTRAVCGITIETAPVGNAGNSNNPATGYGAVNYGYDIGKYEVTVGQYTAFLNSVAGSDPYSLFNSSMGTDLSVAGIMRTGVSGSYSYSVMGSPNHPVTYVSWGDAARFANWLHNGQPAAAEGPGTTETGVYTLSGVTDLIALMAVTRNANAKWFIPTWSEWDKAAYYQPASNGGDADSYWEYPMKTNSLPYSDQPPGATLDNTRVGNFYGDNGYALTGSGLYNPRQNYLTDVGAYTWSPSYYGTFDQTGNVNEWTETAQIFFRWARGGSWGTNSIGLPASYRDDYLPTEEDHYIGFRVAGIPEPSMIALLALAAVGFGFKRHRQKVERSASVVAPQHRRNLDSASERAARAQRSRLALRRLAADLR